jgi:putative ABC transport system substrate-binding protein
MRRRDFIAALGGATVAGRTAAAQQVPVMGLLATTTAAAWAPLLAAFRDGLSETGYVEGRNVTIDQRWAEGRYERLPELASDLIRRQVAVLVAFTTPAALAAKAATATTPIVFTTIGDPVQVGLVTSLSRPAGNITGATHLNIEMGPKLIELMREAIPAATTIAVLINPANPNFERQSRDSEAAARRLGLELHMLRASNWSEVDAAFSRLAELRPGGLVVGADGFLNSRNQEIAAMALRHGLPAIYPGRSFAEAGGLMSYAGDSAEGYKKAGVYAGRILKGEKPADLPVQQITKVELTINMRTAKALGVDIPLPLLGRADEVIE